MCVVGVGIVVAIVNAIDAIVDVVDAIEDVKILILPLNKNVSVYISKIFIDIAIKIRKLGTHSCHV